MKKHTIQLSAEQRAELKELVRKGQAPARKIQHAHVLLKSDTGAQEPAWSDQRITEAFGASASTIMRIRQRFLQCGYEKALNRRPQPERPEKRKINGEMEARLIALACSDAPDGYQRWSVRLLANRFVVLGYSEQISHDTVWVTLKKTNLSPG